MAGRLRAGIPRSSSTDTDKGAPGRSAKSAVYPRPKAMGGVLIRRIVREFQGLNHRVPVVDLVNSDILIAVSGGPDSVALAHLILKYGRKICAPERVVLLHFNHGWRGTESDSDARFVADFARRWGARLIEGRSSGAMDRTRAQGPAKRASPENHARMERKRFFEHAVREAALGPSSGAGRPGLLLTAHHADDQAETLLWRLCTGQAGAQGYGILPLVPPDRPALSLPVFRPLLGCRKSELMRYLKEEGVKYRTDSSNQWMNLQRNRMRKRLMPEMERIFPRAVEHLGQLAQQAAPEARVRLPEGVENILADAQLSLRASNFRAIARAAASTEGRGQVDLPGGHRLIWQGVGAKRRWQLKSPEATPNPLKPQRK